MAEIEMKIRRCAPADTRKVSYLIRKCLIDVNSKCQPASVIKGLCREFSPANLRERLSKFNVYIAVEEEKILGTATLSGNLVMSVFVRPSLHGKGVGTRLMKHLEGIAKKRGIKKLVLRASPNAVEFYRHLGYRKGRDFYNDNGGYLTNMTKTL